LVSIYGYLLPFALMQKVPPKNQGCINPWLKINVSVVRKPDSLRSDSGFRIIDRANDFCNAGFIRPFERSVLYGSLIVFITAIAILVGAAIAEHRTQHTLSSDDQCTQRYKMAVHCNRLDENKGIFGPFVAGQKDEQNRLLHANSHIFYLVSDQI
jgi:hypothetical protein